MPADWRTGPVAITGAGGQVGTALQKRLSDFPNEVRALGRRDALRPSFRDAQVVVHLAGGLQIHKPDTCLAANLQTVLATVAALEGSMVERVVFLSYLTADETSMNHYLRAKGEAEAILRARSVPSVIFRLSHIFGPPSDPGPRVESLLARDGGRVRVLGSGTQRVAPVYREDVVEAIVQAVLDPSTPAGTFELAGPSMMTMDELVRAMNGPNVPIRHLPTGIAMALSRVHPRMTTTVTEVMASDSVPSGEFPLASDHFELKLHDVREVWS